MTGGKDWSAKSIIIIDEYGRMMREPDEIQGES